MYIDIFSFGSYLLDITIKKALVFIFLASVLNNMDKQVNSIINFSKHDTLNAFW